MIPLRDNIRPRRFPYVNYGLIVLCGVVFLFQATAGQERGSEIIEQYGMIPQRVVHPGEPVEFRVQRLMQDQFGRTFIQEEVHRAAESPIPAWLTIFTCIFLHGGWLHFLGNMWFLHIFGDNVEDRFGHLGYLLLYLAWGVAASGLHLVTNSNSPLPTVGASGAIAGVMGAYLMLYPRATVLTLVPIFYFIQIIVLPAAVFLVIWFALQFFQGAAAVAGAGESEGIAWWAHIGGFAAGAGVAYFFRNNSRMTNPPVEQLRPRSEQPQAYRPASPYRYYRRPNW